MMHRHAIFLAVFCSIFSTLMAVADGPPIDYYQPENIRKFADYLYAQGDYLRAAGEYQRYLFSQPTALKGDPSDVLRGITEGYRLGGQPDLAVEFLETLLRTQPNSNLARYELGATYFLTGQYDESIRFLKESQDLFQGREYRWKSQMLIGVNKLMQKRWERAIQHFDQLDLRGLPEVVGQRVSTYKNYAEKGKGLPSKSPLLAGFLSTALPGSGRVYVGRPNDALITVFFLGYWGGELTTGFPKMVFHRAKVGRLGHLGASSISAISTVLLWQHRPIIGEQKRAFLATIPLEIP